MKKIALMVLVSGVCGWGAQTHTIQVISAQKESSITPAFQKKVQQSGLKSTKKKEGDRYVVTVGVFKDRSEAKQSVGKVREKVASDAFVRPVERVVNAKAEPKKSESDKIAPVKTQTAAMIQKELNKETVAAPEKIEVVAKAVVEPKHETVTIPEKVESVAKAVEKSSEGVSKSEVQAQPHQEMAAASSKSETAPKVEATLVVFDNKALYKHQIAEAIQYYKTSPYHRFEPSGLKR